MKAIKTILIIISMILLASFACMLRNSHVENWKQKLYDSGFRLPYSGGTLYDDDYIDVKENPWDKGYTRYYDDGTVKKLW